jgi:L-ascorbate metabolism protein UlaG (beta-lactamase superfamily)
VLRYFKHFGGKLTKERLTQYEKSPNWQKGSFKNLEVTTMDITLAKLPGMLYQQLFKKEGRAPESPLPVISFDKEAFLAPSDKAKFIWYGHSVVLIRMNGKTILIDPMLGPDAAPIAPFSTARFSENTLELINDFPEIDLMLMTHDHYDHVDLASFKLLKPKVKKYFVSIGTARHYEDWGISKDLITEFDWWDTAEFEGIKIHFTPTRHFAGRGATNRAKSFWGGWTFQTEKENIYFSGDGGYGDHFKEVGERLGPFDFGFMECGQYNELWHQIHNYPEETVQAALDAQVKNIMPVHWAGFALAMHPWKEPVERFTAEAPKQKQAYITPRIGELFTADSVGKDEWWEEHT